MPTTCTYYTCRLMASNSWNRLLTVSSLSRAQKFVKTGIIRLTPHTNTSVVPNNFCYQTNLNYYECMALWRGDRGGLSKPLNCLSGREPVPELKAFAWAQTSTFGAGEDTVLPELQETTASRINLRARWMPCRFILQVNLPVPAGWVAEWASGLDALATRRVLGHTAAWGSLTRYTSVTYWAESFLRRRQLLGHTRNALHFMAHESSLTCSQETANMHSRLISQRYTLKLSS